MKRIAESISNNWQTKHWLVGLRPERPVDNGPQEGVYSARVAWEKGKVETRKTSQEAQLSLSSRGYAETVTIDDHKISITKFKSQNFIN